MDINDLPLQESFNGEKLQLSTRCSYGAFEEKYHEATSKYQRAKFDQRRLGLDVHDLYRFSYHWPTLDVYELERFSYPWPTPGMKIYRNYYPCGLENASKDTPVKHGVFVQCLNGSPEEAEWVMDMATRHPIIKGVVAGLDLTSPKLEETIARLSPSGLLKGVRHILDLEKDDWITRDDVNNGLQVLQKHNLTYDLLVRPHHLKLVPGVVSRHPNLKFIINHIAKPPYTEGKLDGWREDMTAIAQYPNVFCKISGLISELNPESWKEVDLQPFVDHVLSVFTPDRCIFGSDWPVFDLVDASYEENFTVVTGLLASLSDSDK